MSTKVLEEHVASMLAISFYAHFLLGLLFVPEDGGNMFLKNVS
jgi:hypothetical protein